ncbi:Nucleotidylyl transferase [Durotheca rogersii]|uniref:Nucleotidylyl transferase n=1 Tax=Durotheca rogersii TaxID=419775 RepID=UPI0022202443|nr:Nucleotidylyl transferase [Durotheca rogersii]KAI5864063.1 Nucleotidylyl transferase [Durotheca rogersii]
MSLSSGTSAAPMAPRPPLPANLVSLFAQALQRYQASNTAFRVLCSVTSSSVPPTTEEQLLAPQSPRVLPRTLLILDSSFNPPTLAHQRMALTALEDEDAANRRDNDGPKPDAETQTKRGSRVLLLLATNNADKAPKPAAFPQRLAMMYIFARDLLARRAGSHSPHPKQKQGGEIGGGGAEDAGDAVDIGVTTEPYFHAKSGAVAASDFYGGAAPTETETETEKKGGGRGGEEGERDMTQVYLTGFDTLIRILDPKYYGHSAAAMAAVLDPLFARARLRVANRTDAGWGSAAEQAAYLERLRRGGGGGAAGEAAAADTARWARRIEMVEGRGEGDAVVSSTKVRDAVHARDWHALRALVSEDVAAWIRAQGLYSEEGGA